MTNSITQKNVLGAMKAVVKLSGVPLALEHSASGYTLLQGHPDGITIERHLLTGTKPDLYHALHLVQAILNAQEQA